jgi:hypothetical protein
MLPPGQQVRKGRNPPYEAKESALGQTATWRLVRGESGLPPIPDITLSRRSVRRLRRDLGR